MPNTKTKKNVDHQLIDHHQSSTTTPIPPFTMMIVTLIKAAAAGLTATLAASSAANMYQTFQIMQQATTASGETTSCEATTSSVVPFNDSATQSCSSVLQKLEGMKRKELLQVYVTSEAPSELASVTGEWNGILLDNNLIIMVRDPLLC
jgi:hypothetical protein